MPSGGKDIEPRPAKQLFGEPGECLHHTDCDVSIERRGHERMRGLLIIGILFSAGAAASCTRAEELISQDSVQTEAEDSGGNSSPYVNGNEA